jgi:hypothetical protein
MPIHLRNKIGIVFVGVNLLILNAFAILAYLKFWDIKKDLTTLALATPIASQTESGVVSSGECSSECLSYIDTKLTELSFSTKPSLSPTAEPVASTKSKTKSTGYFTISGSGSTLNNTWTDVAGSDFYFDPAEHPGLIDVRFEANIKLVNGNGMAYARLFDVTHSIGVNSEVSTNSQTSVLITSGNINFWSGRNQYRVQIKSLTADTAVYESGRLKITVEN